MNKMKKIFFQALWISLFLTKAVRAETYKIYESGQSVISKYEMRKRSDDCWAVYKTGKPCLPVYLIKGSKVYAPGSPVLPLYDVKNWHERVKKDRDNGPAK